VKQIIPDELYRATPGRIVRPSPPSNFPSNEVVAVLDALNNIVFFNNTYMDDEKLFRRALFMEEPVLRLPPKYKPPVTRHWDGYFG